MAGLRKPAVPPRWGRSDWEDLVDFLAGTTTDAQIDVTKILLQQAGPALSTWRKTGDLNKIDGAQISAGTILDAAIAAAAAISKTKISTVGTWAAADIPTLPKSKIDPTGTWTVADIPALPASQITSGRFALARLPDAASGFLKAQGVGLDPAYAAVDWTDVANKPASFTPSAHKATHVSGGGDAFAGTDLLDAIARTTVRKNTGANVGSRRRLNLIEGSNITLTVADDAVDEEVDVTITGAAGGGGGLFAEISRQTLAAAAATISFSSVPDKVLLQLFFSVSVDTENVVLRMQFNGDTAANYEYQHEASGAGGTPFSQGSTGAAFIQLENAAKGGHVAGEVMIFEPITAKSKRSVFKIFDTSSGAGSPRQTVGGGVWKNVASKITSLTLSLSAGNFQTDSWALLAGAS